MPLYNARRDYGNRSVIKGQLERMRWSIVMVEVDGKWGTVLQTLIKCMSKLRVIQKKVA